MIRTVFALLALAVAAPLASAEPSQNLSIKGLVNHPRTLTLADLQHEPPTAETIFQHTGHDPLAGKFTGALLWTLLEEAGITTDPAKKNDLIHHFVVVTGSDGYSAVLSLGEIAPQYGGGLAIVAYEQDGKPIEGANGFARLIIPGDKSASRDVSAITSIEVR